MPVDNLRPQMGRDGRTPTGIQVSAGLPPAAETGGHIDLIEIISRMLEGEDTSGDAVVNAAERTTDVAVPPAAASLTQAVDPTLLQDVGPGRGPTEIFDNPFTGEIAPPLPPDPRKPAQLGAVAPALDGGEGPLAPLLAQIVGSIADVGTTDALAPVIQEPVPENVVANVTAPPAREATTSIARTRANPAGATALPPEAETVQEVAPESTSRPRGGRFANVMANVPPAADTSFGQGGTFPGGDFIFKELLKQIQSGRRTIPQALSRHRAEQRGY